MDKEEVAAPTPQLPRAREAFHKGRWVSARDLMRSALRLHRSISLAELDEYQLMLDVMTAHSTGREQRNSLRLAETVTARRAELGDTRARDLLGLGIEGLVVLRSCRVLGGHGLGPEVGETWHAAFTEQALVLRNASQDGDAIHERRVNYDDVTLLDIGGPGEATTGGGVIGGGFGSGAFIGMMAAAVANALTTKTSIDTVICLQTRNAELFLHHSGVRPDELRRALSPVFSKLRAHDRSPDNAAGVAEQLSRMAELLDKGLIDEDEFERLKSDLLGHLG